MTAALGNLPLGGTPDGKAWCRKALHPADHEIMATRYPGGSTVPTVSSNFTQVMELVPDPGINDVATWDVRIYLRQDPVIPVSVELTTRSQVYPSTTKTFPWVNRTVCDHVLLEGGQYRTPGTKKVNAAFDAFRKGKNFYRITHMGLTVEHVCSSTTNQGTILSGQYNVEPVVATLAGYPSTVSANPNTYLGAATNSGKFPVTTSKDDGTFTCYTAPHSRFYSEGPMDPEMLLQATNGYTGPARDGLYIPLKLNSPDRFVNVDKKYVLFGYKGEPTEVAQVFGNRTGKYASTTGWPYFCEQDMEVAAASAPRLLYGCKECGPAISDTLIKGLDAHASLRLYLRVGVEYVPEIDTETACFARMSPLPDELAVRMYQEISCRMKDAFPRDYNDKSKLLRVINDYAKRLVPMIDKGLSFFAGLPGNPWAGAAQGLRVLTQAYTAPAASSGGSGKKKKRKSPKPSPAQSEPVKAGTMVDVTVPGSRGYWKARIVRPSNRTK